MLLVQVPIWPISQVGKLLVIQVERCLQLLLSRAEIPQNFVLIRRVDLRLLLKLPCLSVVLLDYVVLAEVHQVQLVEQALKRVQSLEIFPTSVNLHELIELRANEGVKLFKQLQPQI